MNDYNEISVKISRRKYLTFFSIVSVILVAATFAEKLVPHTQFTTGLFYHLRLTIENNLAAWFSGMLLLLGAIHAFDGFAANLKLSRSDGIGWLLIAIVLVGFSADEIGSLHERIGILCKHYDFSYGLALMPFGLIVAGLLASGLWRLFISPQYSKQAIGLAIGFCILAMVPIQEFIEEAQTYEDTPLVGAIKRCIEEGTELIGMLVILFNCSVNSRFLESADDRRSKGLFEFSTFAKHPLLITGLALAVPTFAISSALVVENTNRGFPASWLSSALFFLAAAPVMKKTLTDSSRKRLRDIALSGLCIFASGYTLYFGNMMKATQDHGNGPGMASYVTVFLSITFLALWWANREKLSAKKLAWGSLVTVLLSIASVQTSITTLTFSFSIGVAVIVFATNVALFKKTTSKTETEPSAKPQLSA